MKNLLLVLALLFVSVSYSQNKPVQKKVVVIEKGIKGNSQKLTRVYKYKNSRVKRELKFITKRTYFIV